LVQNACNDVISQVLQRNKQALFVEFRCSNNFLDPTEISAELWKQELESFLQIIKRELDHTPFIHCFLICGRKYRSFSL